VRLAKTGYPTIDLEERTGPIKGWGDINEWRDCQGKSAEIIFHRSTGRIRPRCATRCSRWLYGVNRLQSYFPFGFSARRRA